MDMKRKGVSTRHHVKLMLAQSVGPGWYHVNEQEKLQIHVPDGTYASVVRSMTEQGARAESWMYVVDFAPGAYVDEDDFCQFCRDKMFLGVRNGERIVALISPIAEVYLPYKCGEVI